MKLKREVKTVDEDGTIIVLVPLAGENDLTAEIEAKDYVWLIHSGISGNWFSTSNGYVAISGGGPSSSTSMVARIMLDARDDERVTYLDGNSLNLRRSNIEKVKARKHPLADNKKESNPHEQHTL